MVRITRKQVVAIAAPGVAGVIAVAGGSSGAGAAQQHGSHEFDFVTGSGEAVTCQIETNRAWGGSSGTSSVSASTSVGGPAACADATVYVSAEYKDASGQVVRSPEASGTGAVSESWAVGPGMNPKTFHRVEFNDCGYADPGLCATPTYSHVGCAL